MEAELQRCQAVVHLELKIPLPLASDQEKTISVHSSLVPSTLFKLHATIERTHQPSFFLGRHRNHRHILAQPTHRHFDSIKLQLSKVHLPEGETHHVECLLSIYLCTTADVADTYRPGWGGRREEGRSDERKKIAFIRHGMLTFGPMPEDRTHMVAQLDRSMLVANNLFEHPPPNASLLVSAEAHFAAPQPKAIMGHRESEEGGNQASNKAHSTTPMALFDAWKSRLRELLSDEATSDCVIQASDGEMPAHRFILSLNSPIFRAMFAMEDSQEATTGRVRIEEFNIAPLHSLLEYFYSGSIGDEAMSAHGLELFQLADKYQVLPLKAYTEQQLASLVGGKGGDRSRVLQMAVIADMHLSAVLKKACAKMISCHRVEILAGKMWEELKEKRPKLTTELLEMAMRIS